MEYTPKLGFPGFGLAGRILTLASHGLPRHDRHSGPVESHVEEGYRLEAQQLAAQGQFTLPLSATLARPSAGACGFFGDESALPCRANSQSSATFVQAPSPVQGDDAGIRGVIAAAPTIQAMAPTID